MKFSKKDLIFSIISGLITGVIFWRVLAFLNTPRFFDVSFVWLILIVPILWIIGVNLGYFLGQWFSFFNQFGKFVAIGFSNSALDFGVLNLLIFLTGKSLGFSFSIFKGIAFLVAVMNSYFWNKYWAFNAGKNKCGKEEMLRFLGVNLVALAVNVGIASFIANAIDPLLGFSDKAWANIAAVAGASISLIFTFVGFRLIVFKRPSV